MDDHALCKRKLEKIVISRFGVFCFQKIDTTSKVGFRFAIYRDEHMHLGELYILLRRSICLLNLQRANRTVRV